MNWIVDIVSTYEDLAQVVAIFMALAIFALDRLDAHMARENTCFKEIGELYENLIRTSLDNKDLSLFPPGDMPYPTDEHDRFRKQHAVELVISLLEGAHFYYHRGINRRFRERQWNGWVGFAEDWARNEYFREYWASCWDGARTDSGFMRFMNECIARVKTSP